MVQAAIKGGEQGTDDYFYYLNSDSLCFVFKLSCFTLCLSDTFGTEILCKKKNWSE